MMFEEQYFCRTDVVHAFGTSPRDPGRDGDSGWLDRDPMTAAEREAWLDRLCAQDDDPFDAPQEYWDPESCAPPPGQDELTADELAGVREAAGR